MSKKDQQLGMSFGAASSKLRKMLLFAFTQDACMDTCFRCGKKIAKLDEFSIEHKQPWQDSNNPRKLFFDLENIAFSHLKCNSATARNTTRNRKSKSGHKWISYDKRQPNRPWVVQIRRPNGERDYLGSFADLEEAVEVKRQFLKRNKSLNR